LRETAPREGAQGVVLCHLSSSTPWGATLTFTVIFPRAVGADRAQADKIEAAAELAMRASGGTMQCGLGHHISEHAQHALRAT